MAANQCQQLSRLLKELTTSVSLTWPCCDVSLIIWLSSRPICLFLLLIFSYFFKQRHWSCHVHAIDWDCAFLFRSCITCAEENVLLQQRTNTTFKRANKIAQQFFILFFFRFGLTIMVTIHFKYKGNIFIILHFFSLLYELKKVWTFPFLISLSFSTSAFWTDLISV